MMKKIVYVWLLCLLAVGCKDNESAPKATISEPLQQKILQLNRELKLRRQLSLQAENGLVTHFEESQSQTDVTFGDGTVVSLPVAETQAVPLIGVDVEQGVRYWTIYAGGKSGWLSDAAGKRMSVEEGCPQFGVDPEGYWSVERVAEGTAWRIVDAKGQPVKAEESVAVAQFGAVKSENGIVTITFCDQQTLGFDFPTDLSVTQTANCYAVQKAGRYRFRASVRGNGVGSISESGFDPQIAASDRLTADWLWATDASLLSDIRYNPATHEILFSASGTAGNALIVLVDEGSVVWSWHIWITGEIATVTYANGAVFMDRNLGALGAEAGSVAAYGCYYQWGRKDPFYGGTTTETSATAFAEAKKQTVINEKFADVTWVAVTGEISTAEYAAAHPMTFLYNKLGTTAVYDWLLKPVATLWSSTKTLNDPCPPGYRIPTLGQWSDLESGNNYIDGVSDWDGVKYGMTYTHAGVTTWYPAQGYRNQSSGSLVGLGTTRSGNYWSVEPAASTSKFFYFQKKLSSSSGSINRSLDKNRAFAYTVRCCKEN